jgi:glyceraldehyde 3-phosphate dehydrogenase
MAVRVGINGFGRIGRNFYRALRRARELGMAAPGGGPFDLEVVAVNDLAPASTNAHLLAYDSTQGPIGAEVVAEGDRIRVGDDSFRVLSETDPAGLPWGDLGVEVVIESTGRFTDGKAASAHLQGGASYVIISAPATEVDGTFVVGVNDDTFDPEAHRVISNASCTTNCFVPMVKVVDEAFGVRSGLMTTVHAYTNDQNLLDLVHKDLRRARAAAMNIVPASTGAARATSLVMAAMKGRLDGTAIRVPVPCGSITDFTAVVQGEVSAEEVNQAFRDASQTGPLSRVLEYSEAPIVSSDIVGSSASCTFDAPLTMVTSAGPGATLVKVFGWYDNEWGYSNRLVDLAAIVGSATRR